MEMLEYCRSHVYHRIEPNCRPQLIKLKGQQKITNEFEGYLKYTDAFQIYGSKEVKKIVSSPVDSPIRKAVKYFDKNSDILFTRFLQEKYDNDLIYAMSETKVFEVLFNQFKEFYKERKERFMESVEKMLIDIKKANLTSGKTKLPQSHGGVANLLKVLTKTMTQQGAKITSIAKLQYTICMQAGIYIPDEFITDVLVAQDIIQGES